MFASGGVVVVAFEMVKLKPVSYEKRKRVILCMTVGDEEGLFCGSWPFAEVSIATWRASIEVSDLICTMR